jgi:hypothetical protein
MPFTLAHAAAALPFRRLHLVWSGLVIGTFAPDLEYFVRFSPNDGYGHTLVGALVLSLPLAIATLWLFHTFVKIPLLELLPEKFGRRLNSHARRFQFGGAARFTLIVVSILVGMATHLLWDSFTHQNTWLYRRWPLLREPLGATFLRTVPIYKVLQHASTVVGLGALLIWLLFWFRGAEVSTVSEPTRIPGARKLLIFVVVTAIALLASATRAVAATGIHPSHLAFKRFVGLFLVTTISIMWWEFVLYGISRTWRQATISDSWSRSG